MDWLVNSRSESPILDENVDGETEFANPSRFIIEEMGLSDEDVAILKETYFPKQVSKKRKIQFDEESSEDIESDSVQGSLTYAELGDSGSHESEGDDGDEKVKGGSGGERTNGTTNAQPASSPLRPRLKRVKKVPVKHLY